MYSNMNNVDLIVSKILSRNPAERICFNFCIRRFWISKFDSIGKTSSLGKLKQYLKLILKLATLLLGFRSLKSSVVELKF